MTFQHLIYAVINLKYICSNRSSLIINILYKYQGYNNQKRVGNI